MHSSRTNPIPLLKVAILVLLGCLPMRSFAQKNEISFTVGGITTSNQTLGGIGACPSGIIPCNTSPALSINTNSGVAFEGAFAHQLLGFGPASLQLEAPILGAPGRNLEFGGTAPGSPVSSLFFTPSARLQLFRSRSISPFGTFGGGLAHFGFSGGDRNTGALHFGGGADFKTPLPHLALRAEVRDFYAKGATQSTSLEPVSPLRQHNIFAGGGAVLRF